RQGQSHPPPADPRTRRMHQGDHGFRSITQQPNDPPDEAMGRGFGIAIGKSAAAFGGRGFPQGFAGLLCADYGSLLVGILCWTEYSVSSLSFAFLCVISPR